LLLNNIFFITNHCTIINMKDGTLNDPDNLMKTFNGKGH